MQTPPDILILKSVVSVIFGYILKRYLLGLPFICLGYTLFGLFPIFSVGVLRDVVTLYTPTHYDTFESIKNNVAKTKANKHCKILQNTAHNSPNSSTLHSTSNPITPILIY